MKSGVRNQRGDDFLCSKKMQDFEKEGVGLKQLYQKSEIGFSIFWIAVYIVGSSVADQLSESIGITKLVTFAVHLIMSVAAFLWIRKNRLQKEYGLCRPEAAASKFLYYVPLVMLVSCNVWFGMTWNMSVHESLCYVGSMICVGFLEEIIFRGFLFKAMSRDNVTAAILVSSITFGIGHIINLFNGSGAEVVANLCQVCYATAFGFLCVIIFHRGKSLLPCIAAHSTMNALSAFANEAGRSKQTEIWTAVYLTVVAAGYALILLRTLPPHKKVF